MTLARVQCALYVPRVDLEAWFDRARAGDRQMYARGPALNPRHEVPMLIRDWIASGEATPVQARDQATRELLYFVVRCRPAPANDAGAARIEIGDDDRDTPEGKIYLTLVRAANLGMPCPTNARLAEVAGLRDADAARYVLYEKLRNGGLIEIMPKGVNGRVVKIVKTGRVTADAAAR